MFYLPRTGFPQGFPVSLHLPENVSVGGLAKINCGIASDTGMISRSKRVNEFPDSDFIHSGVITFCFVFAEDYMFLLAKC